MPFDDTTSIPRIHVLDDPEVPGKLIFANDSKAKRFGAVLSGTQLQGMHLFSVGYCFACWAAHYCSRTAQEVIEDIVYCFHPSLLTKIALNGQYKGPETYYAEHSHSYIRNLKQEYLNLTTLIKNPQEFCAKSTLESYLNYAAALQYLFPCNVLHAKNSQDPSGGGKANLAIQNLLQKNSMSFRALENIKHVIDHKVVEKVFQQGFTSSNTACLAYIIIQFHELQTLYLNHCSERRNSALTRREFYPREFAGISYNSLKEDVFKVVLQPLLNESQKSLLT